MSYILEALKKSELERGDGETPAIQTIHTASLQYHQQGRDYWPWVLGVLAVVNLGVLGYMLLLPLLTGETEAQPATAQVKAEPHPMSIQATTLSPEPAVIERPAPASNTTTAPAVQVDPPAVPGLYKPATSAISTVDSNNGANLTEAPAPEAAAQTASAEPVRNTQPMTYEFAPNSYIGDIRDLPVDMQAAIPELSFSAHVYSTNPQQRSVVINGNFVEEGDMLTDELAVQEITAEGVIFDYQGTRFRSNVVSGWRVN